MHLHVICVATENQKTVLDAGSQTWFVAGVGGTVRLPRLIGTGPAIELIASGDAINGSQAKSLGLVDACVSVHSARESAA